MFASRVSQPEPPSYEQLLVLSMDLAQRNEELAGLVSVLSAKVEALKVEVASLRRQLGRDSSKWDIHFTARRLGLLDSVRCQAAPAVCIAPAVRCRGLATRREGA
jgi:hypothetical protein